MECIGFQLMICFELFDEYFECYVFVWLEMLVEIVCVGRCNYILFFGEGGMFFGYYEIDDDVVVQVYFVVLLIVVCWEVEMSRFFVDFDGCFDQVVIFFIEVFYFEDQFVVVGEIVFICIDDESSVL